MEYEPLTPILSPKDALSEGAELIHKEMGSYAHIDPIHPEPGSNVANRTKIRKGSVTKALQSAKKTINCSVEIPCGDHVAMERRVAIAEIKRTGEVIITSSTSTFCCEGVNECFL